MHCPNCQTPIQSDASFCGQCGFNLQSTVAVPGEHPPAASALPPTVAVPAGGTLPSPPTALPSIPTMAEPRNTPKTYSSSESTRSPALEQDPPGSASPLPPTVAVPPAKGNAGVAPLPPPIATPFPDLDSPDHAPVNADIPDLPPPEPIVQPDPLVSESLAAESLAAENQMLPDAAMNYSPESPLEQGADMLQSVSPDAAPDLSPPISSPSSPMVAQSPVQSVPSQTMLQIQVARLLHVQTNTPIELPANLTVIHIGKPNDRVPPDVDVSGFPNSEIVSRVHADIRVEGDSYYLEDVGSANGTYVNNMPLPVGNRHRLRPGDRVALGKGDKVTFLFQIS